MEDAAKTEIQISPENIRLSAESAFIFQPRWANADKTRVKAIVKFADGRLLEMEADRKDERAALIRDVFSQYSEGELEMFTHRENCMTDKKRELDARLSEDKRIFDEREATHRAKAAALALPDIRDHKDPDVTRRIRRASNAFEVTALTAAVLMRRIPESPRAV